MVSIKLMIVEYKTMELYGRMLFEKVILIPPFKKNNPMSNEACFLYIMDGEYNSLSEKEQMRIRANEAVLMKCGRYLSQMYASGDSKRYEAVAVHFYPDILKKIYDDKLPAFLKKGIANTKSMARVNSDLLIHKYIEGILFYFENPGLVNEEILILKTKEIILLLHQTKNAPAIHAILANLFNPVSYSFREVIEAHIYSPVTIRELARLTHMSLSSFKREFKKIYNHSPAVYLKDKKLARARELLSASGLRVSDIAFDCGFNNVAHFSKSFKQKYALTPTQYRLTHFNKSLSRSE